MRHSQLTFSCWHSPPAWGKKKWAALVGCLKVLLLHEAEPDQAPTAAGDQTESAELGWSRWRERGGRFQSLEGLWFEEVCGPDPVLELHRQSQSEPHPRKL